MFTISAFGFGYELINFKRKKNTPKKYAIHTSRKYYIRLKYFTPEPRTSIFSLSDHWTCLRHCEPHIFIPITAAIQLKFQSWDWLKDV